MSENDVLVLDQYMDIEDDTETNIEFPLEVFKSNVKKTNEQIKIVHELPDNLSEEQEGNTSLDILKSLDEIIQNKNEADKRSVFVGNLNYSLSAWMLGVIFGKFGKVNRVSIPLSRCGNSKGYAFIEYSEASAAEKALKMDGVLLKRRRINVMPKRTNIPGISSTDHFQPYTTMYSRNRKSRDGIPTTLYRIIKRSKYSYTT